MTLAASVHYVCAAITDQSSATRFRSATLEFTTQHALSGLGWRTHIQPMLLDELQVNHNEAHPALMRMRGQGVFYLSASLPGYVNHAWRGLLTSLENYQWRSQSTGGEEMDVEMHYGNGTCPGCGAKLLP